MVSSMYLHCFKLSTYLQSKTDVLFRDIDKEVPSIYFAGEGIDLICSCGTVVLFEVAALFHSFYSE